LDMDFGWVLGTDIRVRVGHWQTQFLDRRQLGKSTLPLIGYADL